jgi:hypothetical protein
MKFVGICISPTHQNSPVMALLCRGANVRNDFEVVGVMPNAGN